MFLLYGESSSTVVLLPTGQTQVPLLGQEVSGVPGFFLLFVFFLVSGSVVRLFKAEEVWLF